MPRHAQEPRSTIPVRPLSSVLVQGSGLPALQVAVKVVRCPDAVPLTLDGAPLWSWSTLVQHGASRLPIGEHTLVEGWAVRLALGMGGLMTVLAHGRFLFSLEFGPHGALIGAYVARPEPGTGPMTA